MFMPNNLSGECLVKLLRLTTFRLAASHHTLAKTRVIFIENEGCEADQPHDGDQPTKRYPRGVVSEGKGSGFFRDFNPNEAAIILNFHGLGICLPAFFVRDGEHDVTTVVFLRG